MNPEIKKLWLDALRSGKYNQGTRALHTCANSEDKFCCLGVLTDLSQLGEWKPCPPDSTVAYVNNNTRTAVSEFLPQEVADWAGLKNTDPIVEYCGSRYSLVELNDDEKLSFDEIANIIEEQIEETK